jgi:hypothetical protein
MVVAVAFSFAMAEAVAVADPITNRTAIVTASDAFVLGQHLDASMFHHNWRPVVSLARAVTIAFIDNLLGTSLTSCFIKCIYRCQLACGEIVIRNGYAAGEWCLPKRQPR